MGGLYQVLVSAATSLLRVVGSCPLPQPSQVVISDALCLLGKSIPWHQRGEGSQVTLNIQVSHPRSVPLP